MKIALSLHSRFFIISMVIHFLLKCSAICLFLNLITNFRKRLSYFIAETWLAVIVKLFNFQTWFSANSWRIWSIKCRIKTALSLGSVRQFAWFASLSAPLSGTGTFRQNFSSVNGQSVLIGGCQSNSSVRAICRKKFCENRAKRIVTPAWTAKNDF